MIGKNGKFTESFTTIPEGKIRCYITGTLRPNTPEEHVRQRVARSLVEEYGYSKDNIGIEQPIVMGRARKRADIVIYKDDSIHTQENAYIIIEAKKDDIKPTHNDHGVEQLKSYMAASLNCEYGLWVGSEIKAFEKRTNEIGTIIIEDSVDIPSRLDNDGEWSFDKLVPATDALKDVFKRCHNYITTNQGSSKEVAFHELLKLIFCKVYDETASYLPQFYINRKERYSRMGLTKAFDRIQELFRLVCEQYGYIFEEEEKINLNPSVVGYIVAELQKYTLIETDYDYKGQAYEEIVGSNSRGDRGEFFTPRNLCKLAVDIIFHIIGYKEMLEKKIIDPCCGTGGFLKTIINILSSYLYEVESIKWKDVNKAKNLAKNRLKTVCDRNIYGIDFNPILVRAAQMNMVMHGDGSSNIYHENSLLSWGEWKKETRENINDNLFDIIFTNPPFGEDLSIDDPHILEQYELSSFEASTPRTLLAPQHLFIERCYKLLRPGGYLAIITPDNILSNPSFKFIRRWVLLRYKIIASISLPSEMFQPSTGTQTTLLICIKRETPLNSIDELNKEKNSLIFMSTPQKVGHDLRGNIIPLRDQQGNIVVQQISNKKIVKTLEGQWKEEVVEYQEVVPYDQLPQVFEEFKAWYEEFRR
jgi:type I restriction enzyme M protein